MKRKYVILIGDGMGDYPMEALGGKTPLQTAHTPHLDALASCGRMGRVRTIPKGMEPGSDIANMSLLGYDPKVYHTGRAPLEAASMGVKLQPYDVAFRCNLVHLAYDGRDVLRMIDYSAGHITTAEAHELINALQSALSPELNLYPGVSYRHLLVWKNGRDDLATTPPHDITGRPAEPHREVYRRFPVLQSFIDRSAEILRNHPVNETRREVGKKTANAVWLWGQGRAPMMPSLLERDGLSGAMISAVDLLKGLGNCAGLEAIDVPGATGYLDTNYRGKVEAALQALEHHDLVYLHVEAPDEAGHEGSLAKKIEAIEAFDNQVVGPVIRGVRDLPATRLLVAADHLTPIEVRTHVSDPTLFAIADGSSGDVEGTYSKVKFCERTAQDSGWLLEDGVALFQYFVSS